MIRGGCSQRAIAFASATIPPPGFARQTVMHPMPELESRLRELRFWPRGEQVGNAPLKPQEMPAVRTPTRLVAASLTTATQPTVMTALMKTVGSAALAKMSCATVAPDQPLETDDVRWFDRGNA